MKSITIAVSLFLILFFSGCSKSTGPEHENAQISFDIKFAENIAKQATADSVIVKISENGVLFNETDLLIGDSTATGTVTLDFGIYDFRVELYSNSNLIYFGEKKSYDVNVNTTKVQITVMNIPDLFSSVSLIDFGDVPIGSYSNINSLVLNGTNIIDSVFVSCTSGFELSKTADSTQFVNGQLIFLNSEIDSNGVDIYVRGKADNAALLTGFVTCSSREAQNESVYLKLNGVTR